MTDQRVDIKVRVPLEVETTGAAQAISAIPQRVREAAERAAQPGIGKIGWQQPPSQFARQEVDLQSRVYDKLRESLGPQVSFLKNKKEINALYKEELAHVRTMEEELSRLKKTQHGLSDDQLRRREKDAKEARHFVNRLRDTIAVETAHERLSGGAEQGGGIFDMTAQQAMNGGLIGAGMGLAGRAVMAHPILAGGAIAIGTANWLLNKSDEVARYSEDIDVAFTNSGRKMGMGRKLRSLFQAKSGETDRDLAAMGYSGEDLARITDAYGMPSSASTLRSAVRSQAAFARAYGFGENPEAMAGIGRRAEQLGMVAPGQQASFWGSMAVAVERGMRAGVDASETMRSIMAMSEQSSAYLGVLSADYANGLAGIQAALGRGDSRFFKGERGAQNVAMVMDQFQHPKTIGQERYVMNAIMAQFGGRVPTSAELGLKGARGAAYGQMTEIQQMQAIMDLLPELMANGKNPGLLSGLSGQMATGAGQNMEQLLFQAMTGMSPGKLLNMQEAMTSSLTERLGKERAQELSGRPYSMLSALAGSGGVPSDIEAVTKGKAIDASITPVEELRQRQREVHEIFSKTVADSTVQVRLLGEAAKLSADHMLRYLANTPIEDMAADAWKSLPFMGFLQNHTGHSGTPWRPGLTAPGGMP